MRTLQAAFASILTSSLALLPGCYDPRECGDSTVERGGMCVADATEAGTADATNAESNPPDGSGGGDRSYQGCPAGSDVQCASPEVCFEVISTCGEECMADTDCPGPASGNAVQRCEQLDSDPGSASDGCVLFCGGGLTCPAGSTCRNVNLSPSGEPNRLEICAAV